MSFIAASSALTLSFLSPAWASEMPMGQAVAPSAYHEPRTEAEKALDAILKLSDKERQSSWVAVDAPWRDKAKDTLFQDLFSQSLRAAWVSAERKAVKENCNGVYVDGEMCGIDIHPITCSQDMAENYVYRTLRSSPTEAEIEYRWSAQKRSLATYRLTRNGKVWVLDGVSCSGYLKFNMP